MAMCVKVWVICLKFEILFLYKDLLYIVQSTVLYAFLNNKYVLIYNYPICFLY